MKIGASFLQFVAGAKFSNLFLDPTGKRTSELQFLYKKHEHSKTKDVPDIDIWLLIRSFLYPVFDCIHKIAAE